MIPRVTIRQALEDPNLLGTALLGRAGAFWFRPAGSAWVKHLSIIVRSPNGMPSRTQSLSETPEFSAAS